MKRAVVIVGKAPEPGVTKTRLCPPLTPDAAAHLYAAFLGDTVTLALTLGWDRTTVIYPDRAGAEAALRRLLPADVSLQPQAGQGLGAALTDAFASHLGFFERVVMIGSDNPTLPPSHLEQACHALDDHDVSIGPSVDGGYYLLGLKQPHPELFQDITWSTDVVYRQTIERAVGNGLTVSPLGEWYDVDTGEDLERLKRELATLGADIAPATRSVLRIPASL